MLVSISKWLAFGISAAYDWQAHWDDAQWNPLSITGLQAGLSLAIAVASAAETLILVLIAAAIPIPIGNVVAMVLALVGGIVQLSVFSYLVDTTALDEYQDLGA